MKRSHIKRLMQILTGALALATLGLWISSSLERDRVEEATQSNLASRRNALVDRIEVLVRAQLAWLDGMDMLDREPVAPAGLTWMMPTDDGPPVGRQVGDENLYTSVTLEEKPGIWVGLLQREKVYLFSHLPIGPVEDAMRELCPVEGRVYLTSMRGSPVLQWPPMETAQSAQDNRKFRLRSTAFDRIAEGGRSEERYKDLDDREAVGAFCRSEIFHGGLVVEVSEKEAFAEVSGIHPWQVTGGLGLIAGLVLLLVMFVPREKLTGDLFRLWAYAKRYWFLIALTFLFMALYAGANMVRLALMQVVFDDVLLGKGDGALDALKWVVTVFAMIVIVMAAANWLTTYLEYWVNQSIVNDIRLDMATSMLRLDMKFFDKRQTGELLSRLANDVALAQRSLALLFGDLLQQPLMLLGAVTAAFLVNWRLTIMIMVGLPLIAYPIYKLGRMVKKYSKRRQVQAGVVTEVMLQSVSGVRTVKAFQMEEQESERLRKANRRLLRQSVRVARTLALSRAVIEVMNSFAALAVLGFGSYMVIKGIAGATPGDLATLSVIMAQMYKPVKDVTRTYNKVQESMAGVERIFEIMDARSEIVDGPGAVDLVHPERTIAFRDVTFAYDEIPVLKRIEFTANVGEVIALVGETGSGKSTLTDLVGRFYDPTAGRIEIDGRDVRSFTIKSLRKAVSTVTQDAFLFNTTVRQNILCARPGASHHQVEEAARAAEIHEEIMRMDEGYATEVGDRGIRLSGGQRQRITIARAILKDSPILILDEATSALDSQTEAMVQAALDRLMVGRTTFVIAHRLSTIRHADRILVLRDGELVEQGTHEALLAKENGVYSLLHQIQFAGGNGG